MSQNLYNLNLAPFVRLALIIVNDSFQQSLSTKCTVKISIVDFPRNLSTHQSSGEQYSVGWWLTPSRQGTKIIADGQCLLVYTVS